MGKLYQSAVVAAPIDTVWKAVRDFHDMSWAGAVVEKCEAVGDKRGDQVGSRRAINGAFYETLLELSDVNHSIRYSIDEGPPPVSSKDVANYVGYVRLAPITFDRHTFVEWSSSWDDLPEKSGDCGEFCSTIYMALLGALRKHFA